MPSWPLTAFAAACFASVLAIVVAGCSGNQTAEQELEARLQSAHLERRAVFPFAGRVTVDAQSPGKDRAVVVLVLNDVAHPDEPLLARPFATCSPNGDFSFTTYLANDGVPPGDYVATFARLVDSKRGWRGPDRFKNLFNDPAVNKEIAEFRIHHQSPGRKDYQFNLPFAGREGVQTPGKFALTGTEGPLRSGK